MNRKNQNPKAHLRELIALKLVFNLGDQRIRQLLQHANHPQDIFRMSPARLQQVDGIGEVLAGTILKFNDWDQVDQIIEKSRKIDARIITFLDAVYPPLLRQIYDPPMLLWIKGSAEVLETPGIAIVGTRRATRYGLDKAEEFTKALVRNGLTIVSGLALGVDAAAHKATLAAGGKTVAVLGSGIDNIYPSKNKGLAKDIIDQGGAVITEFEPGANPDAGNFPVRNRVVSGLTLGTLVVESGIKGGSMITARSAVDQNREVFAIPHSLDNQNGIGCNAIIKRGWGKLVQQVDDILVEISVPGSGVVGEVESKPAAWKQMELDELSVSICELLEEGSHHIDELGEKLGKKTHLLLSKLLELEMQQCIRQTAGKNFELQ